MVHKLALGEDIAWSLVVCLHQMDTFCTTGESKLKLELSKPLHEEITVHGSFWKRLDFALRVRATFLESCKPGV